MTTLRKLLLSLLVLSFFGNGAAFATQPVFSHKSEKMICLSDIHFDPFFECESSDQQCPLIKKLMQADANQWGAIFREENQTVLPTFRQNTNFYLLQSTLTALKEYVGKENPKFVLILGDFLGHQYPTLYKKYSGDTTQAGYEAFVKKTYQFLMSELKTALPNVDIYPVVGNNDSYIADYKMVPRGRFFRDIGSIWSNVIVNEKNKYMFNQSFYKNGYYSVQVPQSQHRIIVLNSTIFSSYAIGKKMKAAAEEQLAWLDEQLTLAQQLHESVILAFHIPLGVDVYKTYKSKPLTLIQTFWKENAANQFESILRSHPGVVTAILPGHIHKDAFQVLIANKVGEVPVIFTPSISPIYGNNPSFKLFDYDADSFQLNNFEVYYLDVTNPIATWREEYNFDQIFQPGCKQCNLLPGIRGLLGSLQLEDFYTHYFEVSVDPHFSKNEETFYQCAITGLTYSDYKNCLDSHAAEAPVTMVNLCRRLYTSVSSFL